jgi:hypothetical protein
MKQSWIITDKNGKALFETWSLKVMKRINLEKFNVMTAQDYLVALNAAIKANNPKD